ncbi:hypothetical protein DL98DRAFT_660275 [Cadophora sp. DSE1049]|nr:hypothetical protein DL98DRAFT_660275 [Cadophora sp. DSE1049]
MSRPLSYGGSSGRTFRSNNPVPPLPQSSALQTSMSNTFERDDVPLVKEVSSRRPSPKKSVMVRLGKFHAGVLIISTISMLASMGFVSFLWFADDSNLTWRDLAFSNNMNRVVVLVSLIMSISFLSQAGIATSMLASLAVEVTGTPLPHLAPVSALRNFNSGPQSLAYYLLRPSSLRRGGPKKHLLAPILLTLLILTTFLSQLVSFVLLSDINIGLVPGRTVPEFIMTSFDRGSVSKFDTSAWFKKPFSYTAFADYTVKPKSNSRSRVTDTGVSLRALLPVTQREDRVSLQEYQGSATVLDTRVVCVSPDAALDESGNLAFLSVPQEVLQNYSSSSGNSRLVQDLNSRAVISLSEIQILPDGNFTLNQISTQLSRSLLVSQFDDLPSTVTVRTNTFNQYIIVNVPFPFPNNTIPRPLGNPTQTIVGDWLHLVYEDLPRNIKGGQPIIRISLCYNALSAVDMDIQASTTRTRSETIPQRTTSSGAVFNFEAIRDELGDGGVAPNDRGLLEMRFPSGTPEGPAAGTNSSDYIRNAQLMSPNPNTTINYISMVSQRGTANSSHPDIASLFNEIMTSTIEASVGFAMQSLITILAQTAYQDQLPFFDRSTPVRLAQFTYASIPGGREGTYSSAPAGFRPSYIAVLVVTTFHLLLMAGITYFFLFHTTLSTLHNTWQSISQTHDTLTSRYLTSDFASDAEVTQWMVEDNTSNLIVKIVPKDDGRSTGLKEMMSVSRDGNEDADEGGLEISHWDDRLRGGYFHNANVRAGRSVPGRHPWQGERPPWS